MGAAIAAGNQAENGVCALFVMAPTMIIIITMNIMFFEQKFRFHSLVVRTQQILKINNESPRRLVIIVIIPADRDLSFW